VVEPEMIERYEISRWMTERTDWGGLGGRRACSREKQWSAESGSSKSPAYPVIAMLNAS
jgi:hypothetical protein